MCLTVSSIVTYISLITFCLYFTFQKLRRETYQVLLTEKSLSMRRKTLLTLVDEDKLNVSSEREILEFVIKWGKHKCIKKKLEVTAENIITAVGVEIRSKIRFLTLTQEDFEDETVSMLLSSEEKEQIQEWLCSPRKDQIGLKLCKKENRRMYNKKSVTWTSEDFFNRDQSHDFQKGKFKLQAENSIILQGFVVLIHYKERNGTTSNILDKENDIQILYNNTPLKLKFITESSTEYFVTDKGNSVTCIGAEVYVSSALPLSQNSLHEFDVIFPTNCADCHVGVMHDMDDFTIVGEIPNIIIGAIYTAIPEI